MEEVKQLNYNLRVFNTNFHLQMVGGAPMAYSASVAAPMAYSVVPQAKKIAKVKEEKKLTEPNLIELESEISALVDSKNNRFQTSFIKNFRRLLLFKQILVSKLDHTCFITIYLFCN